MSSLAAARADNFYFPPEWRPEFGGLSKFNGSKGANQYEQLGMIRFEMPMDSWCLGCNVHMSKGLRFNAKKDKAGKYFSTQIWSFTMKCYSCQGSFIIETDPQNRTYKFVEGIRQHEQDFIPDVDDSLIQSVDESTRQLLTNDPMFRLQHENEDIIKVQTESERLSSLSAIRHNNYKQDYDMNSILRNKNRKRKNHEALLIDEGSKRGLSIPLVEEHENDSQVASAVSFKNNLMSDRFKLIEKQKQMELQNQSIFEYNKKKQKITNSKSTALKSLKHNKNGQINLSYAAIKNIDVKNFKIRKHDDERDNNMNNVSSNNNFKLIKKTGSKIKVKSKTDETNSVKKLNMCKNEISSEENNSVGKNKLENVNDSIFEIVNKTKTNKGVEKMYHEKKSALQINHTSYNLNETTKTFTENALSLLSYE